MRRDAPNEKTAAHRSANTNYDTVERMVAPGCAGQCLILNAVGGLGVGLVLLDRRGNVLWLNRSAEDLLGAAASESIRRPLRAVLRDPQLCAFWQDQGSGAANGFAEISVSWPRSMELKLHVTECRDAAGRLHGRALLVCDVTRERQAQVELSRAVADRLLALTAGHMPPPVVANLTSQELRVLRLLGRGLSNDEIARQVSISTATVRSHLKRVYRKLHLHSRAEAVSFAARRHLS